MERKSLRQGRVSEHSTLSPTMFTLAVATAGLAVLCFRLAPWIIRYKDPGSLLDMDYARAYFKLMTTLVAAFGISFALGPWLGIKISGVHHGLSRNRQLLGVAMLCVVQWLFVLHAGRWQFGAFDYDNLMEQGWRQAQGQQPYVDYLTTTPPGFNLGIKWAYRVLGVSWDSQLYLTALFTCVTFVWMYFLLRRLGLSVVAAHGVAFAVEAAAMLTLSFWWYNNSATILAAVAFSSVLVYLEDETSRLGWASCVVSLGLLALMKPNIAGVAITGCITVMLLASRRRRVAAALIAGAALLTWGTLAINHVSIPGMLGSYAAVANERGLGAAGYDQMNDFEWGTTVFWVPILALPLLGMAGAIRRHARAGEWRQVARSAFYGLGLVVAVYGVISNGEFREVECPVLLAASGVVAFRLRWNGPWMRRWYTAILCASIASSLYLGATRMRVYAAGPHEYFEWDNNRNLIASGYLKNMRVSGTMLEVEREVAEVVGRTQGPYFFGPRMEFNYTVFHVPSQAGLPAWWHPGTAFGRAEEPRLLRVWQNKKFETLIFLRDDKYKYYSQEFLQMIVERYVKDDHLGEITFYRRRH